MPWRLRDSQPAVPLQVPSGMAEEREFLESAATGFSAVYDLILVTADEPLLRSRQVRTLPNR